MPFEGSSRLGQGEAIKREQAERLLADIYDVVVLLVGAYANKILPSLLPHFPYTLPPGDIAGNISKLGIVHDAVMAWATEALERADVPQPQWPVSEAERALHFKRLEELGRQHAEARAKIGNSDQMLRKAVWQLATLSSDSSLADWNRVWLELGRAITALISASTDLMRLDVEHRAGRINEGRQEPAWQPGAGGVLEVAELFSAEPSVPFGQTVPSGQPPAEVTPAPRFRYDVRPYLEPKLELGNPAANPASNQGGAGAAPSL